MIFKNFIQYRKRDVCQRNTNKITADFFILQKYSIRGEVKKETNCIYFKFNNFKDYNKVCIKKVSFQDVFRPFESITARKINYL